MLLKEAVKGRLHVSELSEKPTKKWDFAIAMCKVISQVYLGITPYNFLEPKNAAVSAGDF